ncbi:MAG: EF-P lysine aminoacylase EpmA [Gammaproteobacteria bacterium]
MAGFAPTASIEALAARARLLARVRAFMADRGVTEVETPVLSVAGNSDPGIEQLRSDEVAARWLRTSPEYAMKRLLAAGMGDIYELGRVFRAGESGRWHNSEFTLLEWYRLGASLEALMVETAELVNACGADFGRRWAVRSVSYGDWFAESIGIDPHRADEGMLREAMKAQDLGVQAPKQLDRDALLDLLLSHVLQPALPETAITLVHGYPASQAALARISAGDPPVAERFELFLGCTELANGYRELTDAVEQRARFEAENRRRRQRGQRTAALDERLLAALESGLPECAGVALGVDRLLMACLGLRHIDEVVAFPDGHG